MSEFQSESSTELSAGCDDESVTAAIERLSLSGSEKIPLLADSDGVGEAVFFNASSYEPRSELRNPSRIDPAA